MAIIEEEEVVVLEEGHLHLQEIEVLSYRNPAHPSAEEHSTPNILPLKLLMRMSNEIIEEKKILMRKKKRAFGSFCWLLYANDA